MNERKTLTDGPPESASDQIGHQTTVIIPFMRGLVASENGEVPDSALIALIRAMMDGSPEIAANFLRGVKEERAALLSLLDGTRSAGNIERGEWETGLRKLQGLIDTASREGKLVELLEGMVKLAEDPKRVEVRHNPLMELGRMDGERVRLLVKATKDRPDLAKVLLRAKGCIARPPKEGRRELTILDIYPSHGLIQTAARFGNTSAVHDLLDLVERTGHMMAEMFCSGSLMSVFLECAKHNDLESLKRIATLLEGLSGDQRLPPQEMASREFRGVDEEKIRKRLKLPVEANPIAVLLLGGIHEEGARRDQNLDFPLLIALESQDASIRQFIAELLAQNPTLRSVVGKSIYPLIKKWHKDAQKKRALFEKLKNKKVIYKAELDYDEEELLWDSENEMLRRLSISDATTITDEIIEELKKPSPNYPDSEEALLAALEAAVHTSSLTAYLEGLFPNRREVSKVNKKPLGEVRSETIPSLSSEYDQDCYYRLIELMNLADQMGDAKGDGIEWARRLTMIFNDVGQAIDYVQSAVAWALAQVGDGAVWRHLTHSFVNWPRFLQEFTRINTPQVEAIKVAMDFKLPIGPFNIEPWKAMMIAHPEVAQYIEMAPDIERYLTECDQPFPETIEDLRKTVLEVVIKKCKFSPELAGRLRNQLEAGRKGVEIVSTNLPSAAILTAVIPPGTKGLFEVLEIMGILPGTSPHGYWEVMFEANKGQYVIPGDSPRSADYSPARRTHEEGAEKWLLKVFQISTTTSPRELGLVRDLLKEIKGIPYPAGTLGCKIAFDLFELEENKRTELIKQLCIAFIYAWPLNNIRKLVPVHSDLIIEGGLNGEELRKELILRILKAKTPDEIFEVYSGKMKFYIDEYTVNLEFLIIDPQSFDTIVDEQAEIASFVQSCLALLEANGGRAQDLEANPLQLAHYVGTLSE